MTALLKRKEDFTCKQSIHETSHHDLDIQTAMAESWQAIAPYWPLQNLISVNPLRGLEHLPFEQALIEGKALYQQANIPKPMEEVNRQTIKWCQAFFDNGQATISMPLRHMGLYPAWRQMVQFDSQLHCDDSKRKQWLNQLPESAEEAIKECISILKIPQHQQSLIFKLILTTLPGWAAHIQYRTEWAGIDHPYPVCKKDYLAVRLIITTLLWSDANKIIDWYYSARENAEKSTNYLKNMMVEEIQYRKPLLHKLCEQSTNIKQKTQPPTAQLVFCIDVRSVPFRRAIEAQGDYETFGFAGFFGVPVRINNAMSNTSYDSCPVLLKPKHEIQQCFSCTHNVEQKIKRFDHFNKLLKKLYQSVKYGFTTPFALVETLGPWKGVWMGLKNFFPIQINQFSQYFTQQSQAENCLFPEIDSIHEEDQCLYAESALRAMGLTKHFAPVVVFCGHGSKTQNNAFASGLDCGACGGNHGGENARVLAAILNQNHVHDYLEKQGIVIPTQTRFVAAEHITTTDEVHIYPVENQDQYLSQHIDKLKNDLSEARKINTNFRVAQMGITTSDEDSISVTNHKSMDWAEVRPEWGLSRNASFIAAPRSLTQGLDLEGRAFLHSYDWEQDQDGSILTTILTAPMVVAQWINSQYLFSTLDNVAYGSGSKITKNITGKIGVMQGNASDLMIGLPLQSVFRSDKEPYHQPLRLMTVIFAPRERISNIVSQQHILQTLVGNGWITLVCIDPNDHQYYEQQHDFTWKTARVQKQSHYDNCKILLTTKHLKANSAYCHSFNL